MARRKERKSSNHTILVVDDQEEILLSLRALLEREGHTVLTAASGSEALDVFRRHEVQVLLVDFFMPRMNGDELIREIRNFDPFVQIILQTGYAGEKPARQMMDELAIQGYHDKSEGPEKLLLWIDVALKAHQLVAQLRDSETLQRELVANVSHEFRTPLNIILGYSDLLIAGDFGNLPGDAVDALQRLTGATHDLSALVSDLLSYAKIEAGATDTELRVVSTQSLTDELTRLAGLLLETKPVQFEVDLGDAPTEIETDEAKLRVILRNLVTNAAKFTNQGKVSVKISEKGRGISVTIADTGPGIRAEYYEAIFDPFRQINGSTTRLYRGIGLGLALSRKLATLLGGEISVESEVDRGSAFTLVVPGTEVGKPTAASARAHESWVAA